MNWGRDIHDDPTVENSQGPPRRKARLSTRNTIRHVLVLCLDTSGSMRPHMTELNAALRKWTQGLAADEHYGPALDIALVTFGDQGVGVWRGPERLGLRNTAPTPFLAVEDYVPPQLVSGGRTPMGGAVRRSMEIIAVHKKSLRMAGANFYRPLLWLVTDGDPNDDWRPVVQEATAAQRNSHLIIYAVGLGVTTAERRHVLEEFAPELTYTIDDVKGNLLRLLDEVSNSMEKAREGHTQTQSGHLQYRRPS